MIKGFLCDDMALVLALQAGCFAIFSEYIQTRQLAFVLLDNLHKSLQIAPLADTSQYTFITHPENMHFERQNPAFFAEILARVGVEPNEAFIISTSSDDIYVAGLLGVNGICISSATNGLSNGDSWSKFVEWLIHDELQVHYPPIPLAPYMIVPQLMGNIGALKGLLHNIKPEFWHQHPDPKERSPYQIVCHLLKSEEMMQRTQLEKIILQDNPFLSQSTVAPTAHCDVDENKIVDMFIQARQQTINWLNQLPPNIWGRGARHSIFGPTTFLEMAQFIAQHDRLHLNQLCQTLKKCR